MQTTSLWKRSGASLYAIAMVTTAGVAAPAMAQEAPQASSEATSEAGEITVTARKRGESILKVPVTVVAVTSEMLERKGIASVPDLAASTPGININNSSSGHADRSFQQIIMRGFTPSSTLATTTSMFIDGVPVSSPSELTSISNPDRVEILKGPQSAYFGRSTFAGAINIVNKAPSDTWTGTLSGQYGTQDSYRIQGSVEGPIFGDVLTFRITGDKYKKNGTWTNSFNGEALGTTASQTGTAMLEFKPSADFKMRVFGLMSEDNDGAPASARVNAYYVSTVPGSGTVSTSVTRPTTGTIIQTGQSNCTLTGDSRGVLDPTTGKSLGVAIANPFICGTIPSFADAPSVNTTTTDGIRSWLAGSTNRVVAPNDSVTGYGLRRKTQHIHTTMDYTISDALTASVLAGYNHESWSTLIDLDGYDTSLIAPNSGPKGYSDFPFLIERNNKDWSVEGRMNYNKGPFRAVAGVSYLKAQSVSGGGGTSGAFTSAVFAPGDNQINKTTGLFFGLTYDLTSKFSVSLEGRYQIDNISLITRPAGRSTTSSAFIPAGNYAGGSLLAERTYKNFAPRIIANYQANSDLMFYGSIAKGVNPALSNVTILAQSDAVQTAGKNAGGALLINPEKVTNYEVGMKGLALNGALRFTLAAYYAQWRDQVNALTIVVPDSTSSTGLSFIAVSANSGKADLYGIEGDMNWKVNKLITIDAAGAINDSKIKVFKATAVSQLTGVFDYSGKKLKQTSKYSANVGVTFGGEIDGLSDASWYLRGDWNYKSGFFTDEANVAKTKGRHVFNARASITQGALTFDVFVNNIFNDRNPISAADNFVFTPTFNRTAIGSAIQLGLPELRTAGVQAKIRF
jgi:iron complex outermembrane receptor protein